MPDATQALLDEIHAMCCLHAAGASHAVYVIQCGVLSNVMMVLLLFNPQVACQATATVVFLDDKYRPVRVPGSVKQLFGSLNAEYKAPAEQ